PRALGGDLLALGVVFVEEYSGRRVAVGEERGGLARERAAEDPLARSRAQEDHLAHVEALLLRLFEQADALVPPRDAQEPGRELLEPLAGVDRDVVHGAKCTSSTSGSSLRLRGPRDARGAPARSSPTWRPHPPFFLG